MHDTRTAFSGVSVALVWIFALRFAKNSLTYLGKSFLNNAILEYVMNMVEGNIRYIDCDFVLALCCTAGDMLVESIY